MCRKSRRTSLKRTETGAKELVLRQSKLNKLPESVRVIELNKVAQFVDDYVIGNFERKIDDLVIKIEVPFLRAAPPSRFVILYKDLPHLESIGSIPVPNPGMHQDARFLTLTQVLLPIPPPENHSSILALGKRIEIGISIVVILSFHAFEVSHDGVGQRSEEDFNHCLEEIV